MFEDAETKAFATSSVFRDSSGHETKWGVSLGKTIFLLSASLSAKDNFVGSFSRTAQLRQMKLKHMFPAAGRSAPLLAAPYQASHYRTLNTQLKSNREGSLWKTM